MRAIIFLGGLLMAASWGLAWIEPPFAAPDLSPMALARDGRLMLSADSSWQVWVFLGGFAAATLALLLAVGGWPSRLLALAAGASPMVLVVDALVRAEALRQDLGLPVPFDFGDLRASWAVLENFVRLGFWAYLAGSAILLAAGATLLVRRRR
jgi:hypothetical protein